MTYEGGRWEWSGSVAVNDPVLAVTKKIWELRLHAIQWYNGMMEVDLLQHYTTQSHKQTHCCPKYVGRTVIMWVEW